jgi:hypothetical protein
LYNAALSGGLVFPAERRASDHRHRQRDDKQDEASTAPKGQLPARLNWS